MLCEVERPFTRARPYDLGNEEFVTKFLADVLSLGWSQRAQVSVAKGHEGAQLGIYFKREEGVLKISGFETIP